MVAITATNYATPPARAWQDQARVVQARREADQAEGRARQLRNAADQAERDAANGQARVSALSAQAAQNENTYSAQLQQQRASSQARQAQAVLAPVAAVASNRFAFPANPLQSKGQDWTSSLQRPSSGRLLNQLA